jgi:hypothetical protein
MSHDDDTLVPGTRIPKPTVELSDGNAFVVIGACRRALRRAGVPTERLDAFSADAMSGDYDHVLRTAMRWCEVDV